jgi:hypothetical protein
MDTILASAKPVIHVVRLANQIVVKNQIGKSGDFSDGRITSDMLANTGLRENEIPEVEAQLAENMEKAGSFLNAYR